MKIRSYRRKPESQRNRGAALVLTLIFVALLTTMVIAFYATMRVEQRASHSFANTQRAKMVAQGAVSHGIELLRANIPEPALISESAEVAPGEVWVTNPGRLLIVSENGSEKEVPLHTGGADRSPESTEDPDVHSVDLNEPLPGRTDSPIAVAMDGQGNPDFEKDAPPMRVKWVPVLQRPSKGASENNQISGRYAFWMDDESSKINFNVALGKPSRKDSDPQGFWEQYDMGMMTPLFTSGAGDVEFNEKSQDREWALGRPRSVNLDVVLDDPEALNTDALLAHAWLRGFARYPESILQFVDLPDDRKRDWFNGSKYNLTFYSRSPEFNAFGRPRLFTTNIPLSLEAGPMYQMPFVYNGPEVPEPDFDISGVLNLHTLMGSLGFTDGVKNEDGRTELAGNVVNRAQFEMLKRYMARKWPGYEASFVDKYGERECYQMALSMLLMARMATTTMSNANRNTGGNFSHDYAWRTSSTIYSPPSGVRTWWRPERHYWPVELNNDSDSSGAVDSSEDKDVVPMLPQYPGPFITEVLLTFQVVRDSNSGKKKVRFRYKTEYYMPDLGPEVFLKYFPAKVDYLRVEPTGVRPEGMPDAYELGPANPDAMARPNRRNDQDWNFNFSRKRLDSEGKPILNKKGKPTYTTDKLSLGALRISPNKNIRLVSRNSSRYGVGKNKGRERKVVTSPWRYLGKFGNFLPHTRDNERTESGGRYAEDQVLLIDSDTGVLKFDVKWRLGMGILNDSKRTVQMIPLGETNEPEHVLEAQFEMDTRFSDGPKTVSWQISDPRLSWHKESWIRDDESEGTPGLPNSVGGSPLEPEDDSSEKSKLRYFQRGPGRVKALEGGSRSFGLNRPDEYNSRSRITSKGYWSMLHTGIQGNSDAASPEPPTPWRTLDLGGGESNEDGPPDYLLLDLLGATYPMQHDQWRINSTLPDEFSTVSFMNSTAGQVNLNSKVYPDNSPFFSPPERKRPLEAVFKHLRSDGEVDQLVEAVADYQEDNPFLYVGELAEVPGYERSGSDATQFENEELLRHMMGSLTTNSNTFGLWGVSQVVKKIPGHTEWGEFEDGDRVLAEKRFHAIIERYVWPGNDGVPGNAHVNSTGEWDRIAQQRAEIPFDGAITDTLFQLPGSPPLYKAGNSNRLQLDKGGTYPVFDGPQKVEMDRFVTKALGKVAWHQSSLEDAYNPPQPVIKYRVVYFRYLDE